MKVSDEELVARTNFRSFMKARELGFVRSFFGKVFDMKRRLSFWMFRIYDRLRKASEDGKKRNPSIEI